MQVWAGRIAGRADGPDFFTLLDVLPSLHINRRQVAVFRVGIVILMVQRHMVAIAIREVAFLYDRTVEECRNDCPVLIPQVYSRMELPCS